MLLLAKRANRLNSEQYRELKELVTDGDEADLEEAIALRREFVDGTCTTTRDERNEIRNLRTKEKIFDKIAELQVRVACMSHGVHTYTCTLTHTHTHTGSSNRAKERGEEAQTDDRRTQE